MSTPTDLGETTDTLFRAVAAVADALYVIDSGGRIAFLNPAAFKILGYTEERELLGKPSHATIHYLRPDGSRFRKMSAAQGARPARTGRPRLDRGRITMSVGDKRRGSVRLSRHGVPLRS